MPNTQNSNPIINSNIPNSEPMLELNISNSQYLNEMLHCSPWQDDLQLLNKANREARQILLANQLNETTMLSKPELREGIIGFLNHTIPLLSEVEEILDSLKEAFLELLHLHLNSEQVSLATRLVLGLDIHWELQLIDKSHPDAHKVEQIINTTPELTVGLQEIARQSLFLRGVVDVQKSITPPSTDQLSLDNHGLEATPLIDSDLITGTNYHVCLSGSLSHFYFPLTR